MSEESSLSTNELVEDAIIELDTEKKSATAVGHLLIELPRPRRSASHTVLESLSQQRRLSGDEPPSPVRVTVAAISRQVCTRETG